MLGASSFSENSISDQGILLTGVAEMSGIGANSSIASGIMSGVVSLDGNFTATTAAIYISGSTNAELSANATLTSAAVEVLGSVLNTETIDLESSFTKTSNSIMIGSGVSTKDLNLTMTSTGDLLYTEITPSDEETYTEIVR